jgi:hypothetical protein
MIYTSNMTSHQYSLWALGNVATPPNVKESLSERGSNDLSRENLPITADEIQ